MYIKYKLTSYNIMIKIGKQDLVNIIDIKKYTRVSHAIYQQKFCKKMQFNNFLIRINKNYFLIEFSFEIIVFVRGQYLHSIGKSRGIALYILGKWIHSNFKLNRDYYMQQCLS